MSKLQDGSYRAFEFYGEPKNEKELKEMKQHFINEHCVESMHIIKNKNRTFITKLI